MITTNEGGTLEIFELDEWVVRMIIKQPCPNGGDCHSTAIFTKTQMIEELSRAKPPLGKDSKKGAKQNDHTRIR